MHGIHTESSSPIPTTRQPACVTAGFAPLAPRLEVVAKGAMAETVAIRLHAAIAVIPHWLAHLTPALKGYSPTIWTFLRASFAFALDIWQLKDDNPHGKLLWDGGVETTILLGARLFGSKPTVYATDTIMVFFKLTESYR